MTLITKIGKDIGKVAYSIARHKVLYKKALLTALPLSQSSLGDFVRINNTLGVLIEKSNRRIKVLSFVPNAEVWFYSYGYSPYLGEKGTSHDVETKAKDRYSGKENYQRIKEGNFDSPVHSFSAEDFGFPIFDACKKLGADFYLPAIKELENIFANPKLLIAIKNYLLRAYAIDIDDENTYKFWSSSDNDETSAIAMSWNVKSGFYAVNECKGERLQCFAIYEKVAK